MINISEFIIFNFDLRNPYHSLATSFHGFHWSADP